MAATATYQNYADKVAAALAAYAAQTHKATHLQYGAAIAAQTGRVLHAALDQTHDAGALVLIGYTMEGGRDQAMALRAAVAVELFHAILGLQASGDAEDQAAARAAESAAQILLANLEVDAEINRRAVSIMNRTLLLQAHARTFQKTTPKAPQIAEWKALERAVNPLHVGMVLAGADCHATDGITPFATHLGLALIATDQVAANHYQAARRALAAITHPWPQLMLQLLSDFLDRRVLH
ncbi:MAG TPA: hypothetical protein VLG11_04085 [Candidatus Saccharimonadales bacterium]|nr:hypothetical protein [Candidatus Saccharimonadales bacterium]